jgi:ABC-type Fe3+-siderophore transport system permease subunit
LAIPHVVRSVVGPDYRWVLPYSYIFGGVFLTASDILGRTVMSPIEIPVRIVTAVFGGHSWSTSPASERWRIEMASFGDTFTPARRPGHRTVRGWHVAMRVLAFAGITALLVILYATWAMTLGPVRVPSADVVMAMVGRRTGDTEYVVQTLRLPCLLCAVLFGASRAIAGAIFQGLTRNPLVSPDIIGIDAGATLCVVSWLVTGQNADLLPLGVVPAAMV